MTVSDVWGPTAERRKDPSRLVPPERQATGRRKERRYLVDQPAQIFTAGISGPMWTARIRDISSRGMQFVVNEPLTGGPHLTIRWNRRDVNGTIRYRQSAEANSYRIGVEFDASSNGLVIDMLAKQSDELQQAAFLVTQQEAVLQSYLTLLDLASDWPQFLAQPMWSPARYGSVLDRASDPMIVTSMTGTILFWNKAAEKLYGWTREEAVGCEMNQLLSPKTPAGPAIADVELRHVRKDGSVIRVRSCSIVQQDSGGEAEATILINRQVD